MRWLIVLLFALPAPGVAAASTEDADRFLHNFFGLVKKLDDSAQPLHFQCSDEQEQRRFWHRLRRNFAPNQFFDSLSTQVVATQEFGDLTSAVVEFSFSLSNGQKLIEVLPCMLLQSDDENSPLLILYSALGWENVAALERFPDARQWLDQHPLLQENSGPADPADTTE